MRDLTPEEWGLVSGGQNFVITISSVSNGGAGEHNTQGNVAGQSGGTSGAGQTGGTNNGGTNSGFGFNILVNDNS